MKPFDLQEALNGAPVRLRNGCKAFIFKNIQNTPIVDFDVDYPLIGMLHNHTTVHAWSLSGKISLGNDCAPGDIVGMWEEPKLTSEQTLEKAYQENLPLDAIGKKAFVIAKTKDGDYVIQEGRNIIYIADFRYKWEFYKEPAPKSDTITVTLPKPFKAKKGDDFWFISEDLNCNQELKIDCVLDSNGNPSNYKDGNCFRSESDAQAWLDAMKNALEG